jgi:hypothetical protein
MAPDWGISERYDPQIIGASFRMPVVTFASPTTEVWNHVYCLAKCKDGNCKEMKCKYCDEVCTGGAQRIIKHLVKCHSFPSSVTDWGRRRQATAKARKDEKSDAKKLTKAFDGVADDATQQSIKGSIDKLGLATELCHEEVCNWDDEIDDKFDGNHDHILKGYISSVTKNDIRIKFEGGTHVSSYPRRGFGQFVRRSQYRAVTESHYGTILIDERMANVTNKGGWLEGDLLDFAMSSIFTNDRVRVISASCYLFASTGNDEFASGFGPSNGGPCFAFILGAEIAFASNPLSPSLPCWKRQFLLLGLPHSAERWIFVRRVVVLDMFS